METMFKSVIASGGAVASFLFGGWSMAIQMLLLFVAIDYITGVLAASKSGELSSRIGGKGIVRKVMIFLIVAVGHGIDQLIGDGHIIRDATITFYVANEVLSIVENSGKIGLPVPDVIAQAIEVLKGKEKKGGKK